LPQGIQVSNYLGKGAGFEMNAFRATTASRPPLRKFGPGVLVLLLFAAAGSLWATMVVRMSLEEVVDASESIVQGTVVRAWSDWDEGHKSIWTHYELRVADRLKGTAPAMIVVSEPGGTVGETELQVVGTPQYEVGEEVVLFAERTPLGLLRTCGWGQGKFQVTRASSSGKVTVRTAARGIQLVERPAGQAKAKGTPLGEMNGLELEQFKTRIRELVSQRALRPAR
jgi:hypothetical protein